MPGAAAVKNRGDQHEEHRSQKKLMEAKIAEVRDVVKNVRNEDIILVLQAQDLDVEKTIQAFCEDGARAILDTWKSGGGKSNRKRGNKRKGKGATEANGLGVDGAMAASISSLSPCPTHSDTHTSPPGSVVNGDGGDRAPVSLPTHNGRGGAPLPQRTGGRATAQRAPVNGAVTAAITSQPPAASASLPRTKHDQPPQLANHVINGPTSPRSSVSDTAHRPNSLTDPLSKKKYVEKDMKNLARHDALIERVEARFNEEIMKAGDRMRHAFRDMHEQLRTRENELDRELDRCKEDGKRVLTQLRQTGKEMHTRGERAPSMAERQLDQLRNDIKHFVNDRRHEEELGSTIRFQWTPDPLIAMINNFGQVVPVKQLLGVQKHSSHSSLVSSVGEDSGLGMTSPTSPEKQTGAHASGDGMLVSDSLTPEQLEELNRRLVENLQLQGISKDVLSGVTGPMPARRRPTQSGSSRGSRGSGGAGRGRGGRGGGRGGAAAPPMPQLSLFDKDNK